ncbi:S8 family peptidase [Burkholderia lata]|uniref:S8 family peptidase n=1 Tax=Burkholderia lata (strain ATCC 17760 / DSM 23089 / LMG 22485 / NCIMB 9086 / R18194 / 383) TaxID=482957 RepID=UPI001452A7CA|nr:S8 family serine peptidase [Burkholderia lata]VWB89151.1 Serine metalloprotease MrpA [Burkholderia lata]
MHIFVAGRSVLYRLAWLPVLAVICLTACSSGSVLIPPSVNDVDPALIARMSTAGDKMVVIAVANPAESVPAMAGTTAGGYSSPPGYLAYGSARATMAALAKAYGLREVTAWPILPLYVHCAVLEITGSQTREEVLAKLARDGRVRLVEPLHFFRTLSSTATYDGNYESLQRGMQEIDAVAAQRVTRGDGVHVAVIDTGVDTTHPGLAGRVELTRDFVGRDKVAFNRDVHGTAVAGVIAASPSGGRGVTGVAPGAKILALKACWGVPGTGTSACNSLTLAQALSVAIEAHAQVINLSLTGPPDPLLGQLVDYALRHGTVVVGAVPPDGDRHAFPVGVPSVISADLPGSGGGESVYAPGRDVLTLTPGGHYDYLSGSSFSAAYVSGIAALLLAVDPHLDAARVYAALKGSESGAGQAQTVNACHALAAVTGGVCKAMATLH